MVHQPHTPCNYTSDPERIRAHTLLSSIPSNNMHRTATLLLRLAALSALAFSAATAWDYYGPAASFCAGGAGCGDVHTWSAQWHIDLILPALGLTFYSLVLALTFAKKPKFVRFGYLASMVGGVGALGFIAIQKFVIGAWCWLCLGVDVSAVVAALAAAMLWRAPQPDSNGARRAHVWLFAALMVIGQPILWGATTPSVGVPDVVRALYGDDVAPIVVLSDPQCPYCRLLHSALDEAVATAAAQGVVTEPHYVLVPLSFHEHARGASSAVLCAGAQGQEQAMLDLVYTSENIDRAALDTHATTLGLDLVAFGACLVSAETNAAIEANIALADAADMQGLPTTWIGEMSIIGFDARSGAEPYVDAILRASERRGPSRRWGLHVVWALVSIVVAFVWGRKAARPQAK